MGPEATVLLMSRIIALTPAEDDADHVPLLVDSNTAVPSRIARLIEGAGADPAPVLARMAEGLERGGAAALAMPCNTAHHYAGAIRRAVSVPFLDMVALAVAAAERAGGRGATIAVVGSPALRRIGLYDRALAARGMSAIYPSDETALLDAIRSLKRMGPTPEAEAAARRAIDEVAGRGAGVALIACTEFSMLAGPWRPDVPVIDTLELLAEAVVAFATGGADDRPAMPAASTSPAPSP